MVKRIRRRLFLVLLALAPLAAYVRGLRAVPLAPSRPAPDPFAALPAYLDTLIPPHGGPSATALGVDRELLAAARAEPSYGKLLAAGCRWLDAQARVLEGGAFGALSEAGRIAIAQNAQDAAEGSGEWTFYQRVRAEAFRHYYADPRAWSSVGFEGAPQPAGYLDYAEPPVNAGDA